MGNYVFGRPNVGQMVHDYMQKASRAYISEYSTGEVPEVDEIMLNAMRGKIRNAVRRVEPIDLADLYTGLMNENMARIRQVEGLMDEEVSTQDLFAWSSDARAFLDIIETIRDRRYDFEGSTFVEDGKRIVASPIDMIEEEADYSAHNSMVKRTSNQQHDFITTQFIMKSNIDGAIADMTTDELDTFKGVMQLKKVAYESTLSEHNANSEYVNNFDRGSVPITIAGPLNQCIWLQKLYNVDMVRKYGHSRDGLIAFVDNIDEYVDNAIMGF